MPFSTDRSFGDPDEYCSSVRGFQYDLTVTNGGKFAADLIRVDLQNVWMHRYATNLPYVAESATMRGRATFAFRVEEGPSFFVGTEEIWPNGIERLGNGETIYTRASGAASLASMSLPVDALAAIGTATAGCDFAPPVHAVTERPLAVRVARLQRLHAAAGYLARTAPEIIANSEAARGLEHELVQALIACLGPAHDEEDRVAKRRHALVMRRFHAAVAASGDQPVYLSDLCAAIGASDRTLQIGCQEQLGMGPRRYLWLRRMQHVRHALALADPRGATVTDIATAHGFWELGRFAVAYRSYYGESPSATLARAPDRADSQHYPAVQPRFSETA